MEQNGIRDNRSRETPRPAALYAGYDSNKRRRNQRKHKIDLAECETVFDAPMLTREDTREDYGEERLVSLGLLKDKAVVLVWTDRAEGPRLISCREAESHEQATYFQAYPPY